MILITIISACAPKAKSPEAAQENDGKEEAALGVGESAQVTTGINDDEIDPELKTCYDKSKQELNEKLINLDITPNVDFQSMKINTLMSMHNCYLESCNKIENEIKKLDCISSNKEWCENILCNEQGDICKYRCLLCNGKFQYLAQKLPKICNFDNLNFDMTLEKEFYIKVDDLKLYDIYDDLNAVLNRNLQPEALAYVANLLQLNYGSQFAYQNTLDLLQKINLVYTLFSYSGGDTSSDGEVIVTNFGDDVDKINEFLDATASDTDLKTILDVGVGGAFSQPHENELIFGIDPIIDSEIELQRYFEGTNIGSNKISEGNVLPVILFSVPVENIEDGTLFDTVRVINPKPTDVKLEDLITISYNLAGDELLIILAGDNDPSYYTDILDIKDENIVRKTAENVFKEYGIRSYHPLIPCSDSQVGCFDIITIKK